MTRKQLNFGKYYIISKEGDKMKKLMMIAATLFAICAFGAAFEFVNDGDYGYSYVQINQDLDSFSFTPDWHSLGNAGKVGYVVYTADMSESERASYMEANANNPQFQKNVNGGLVEIKDLKAGDKVGFYEVRPNGRTYTQTAFKDWKDSTWLAFDKNGGHGKDEWMSLGDISTTEHGGSGGGSGGSSGAPNGAPLPGALAVLLVGAVGAGAWKAGKNGK